MHKAAWTNVSICVLVNPYLRHMARIFGICSYTCGVPYVCTCILVSFVIHLLGVFLHTDGVMSQTRHVHASGPNTWMLNGAVHAYLITFIAQIYFSCDQCRPASAYLVGHFERLTRH